MHLANQGSKLRLRSGRLVVTGPDGAVLGSVPARKVRRVVVHGNVGITTPALTFLLRQEVTVTFVSLSGRMYGMAASLPLPAADRIAKQLELARSGYALEFARAFVQAKISSQIEHLRRKGESGRTIQEIRSWLRQLERTATLEKVRGLEGMASRLYFSRLASLLPQLGFEKRLRRPPRDAVNATLSYGYAMLLGTVASALVHAGLHTEIGLLHVTGRRKPSLALDLMEEFRVAMVDIPVISGFLRGRLRASEAVVTQNGVVLGDELKKNLIEIFEERLASPSPVGKKSYEELIFYQAERLAAAIVHGKRYRPFVLPRGG